MADLYLRKLPNGTLAPDDEASAAHIAKWKIGAPVRAEVKRVRNYKFLKKFFTLVKLAYDIWSETMPEMTYKGEPVQPCLKKFRADLTIMCGYYTPTFNARGEVRLEAKSISFASMDEEDFEKLYSKAISVVLEKVLTGRSDLSPEKLRNCVDAVLAYD